MPKAQYGPIKCFNAQCRHYDIDEPDHCSKPLHAIKKCIDAVIERESGRSKGFYVTVLISNECACGRAKKKGQSFCYRCYSALSAELKRRLYDRIGYGYEAAYEAAVQYIETYVW